MKELEENVGKMVIVTHNKKDYIVIVDSLHFIHSKWFYTFKNLSCGTQSLHKAIDVDNGIEGTPRGVPYLYKWATPEEVLEWKSKML